MNAESYLEVSKVDGDDRNRIAVRGGSRNCLWEGVQTLLSMLQTSTPR